MHSRAPTADDAGSVLAPASRGDGPAWVSDVVVDVLERFGCRFVTMTPGSSFRGLHDSLVNHRGGAGEPELVMCLNEQIAVSAAHAYAKATGDVAVVVLHDLVGLLHAHVALYNAWCDGAPLVVLGGSGPRVPGERRWIDWVHSADTQSEVIREVTKADEEPVTAEDVPAALSRAYRAARTEPSGPVYVALDVTLQEQPLAAHVVHPSAEPDVRQPPDPVAPRTEISAAARALVEAESPVLIPGRIGLDAVATPTLVELAELLAASCVDEPHMVTMPSAHPLNLNGDRGIVAEADVRFLLEPNDTRFVLERAGSPTTGLNIVSSLRHLATGRWSNAGKAWPSPDIHLPSTGRAALEAVCAEVREAVSREQPGAANARRQRAERLAARHHALRDDQRRLADSAARRGVITPGVLAREAYAAVRDVEWLLAIRHPYAWPEGLWEFDGAGRYLGGSGGGGLGYGPGALLGGGLAARDTGRLAVGIIGDGDWLMNPAMLWTAVHHALPILAVVLDNRAFGNDLVHQQQIAEARGRPVERAVIGTSITEPVIDLVMQARAYGAWAEGPIDDPDALGPVLRRAVGQVRDGRVAFVHVLIEGAGSGRGSRSEAEDRDGRG